MKLGEATPLPKDWGTEYIEAMMKVQHESVLRQFHTKNYLLEALENAKARREKDGDHDR